MTISEMVETAWLIAEEKGLHQTGLKPDGRENCLILLGLIHSEVSEAMQEIKRHGVNNDAVIGEELADVVIRVGDLAGILGIDLEECVKRKNKINMARPSRFGTPREGEIWSAR